MKIGKMNNNLNPIAIGKKDLELKAREEIRKEKQLAMAEIARYWITKAVEVIGQEYREIWDLG